MRYLLLVFLMVGCGMEHGKEKKPYPVVEKPAPEEDPGAWEGRVKTIVQEHCALSGCHAGQALVLSGEAFRANKTVRNRIQRDNMPRKTSSNYGRWTNEEKTILLNYLDSNS